MPRIVGLTGGIATGKSTVSKIWAKAGATIIDADRIARDVVKPGRPAYLLIRRYFGPSILYPDGSINRRELGRIVFSDAHKRRALNLRIHPFIITSMLGQVLLEAFVRWRKTIVFDAPLLFESGILLPLCSRVVVVYAPANVQMDRLLQRDGGGGGGSRGGAGGGGGGSRGGAGGDGLTLEDAQKRIDSQMPIEKKVEVAHYVIDNSQSMDRLQQQALSVLDKVQPPLEGEIIFRSAICFGLWKLAKFLVSLF